MSDWWNSLFCTTGWGLYVRLVGFTVYFFLIHEQLDYIDAVFGQWVQIVIECVFLSLFILVQWFLVQCSLQYKCTESCTKLFCYDTW